MINIADILVELYKEREHYSPDAHVAELRTHDITNVGELLDADHVKLSASLKAGFWGKLKGFIDSQCVAVEQGTLCFVLQHLSCTFLLFFFWLLELFQKTR